MHAAVNSATEIRTVRSLSVARGPLAQLHGSACVLWPPFIVIGNSR